MRWIDRVLGAAFGLVRGIAIAAVLVLAFATFAPNGRMIAGSAFGRPLLGLARAASWLAPADLRARFQQGATRLRGSAQEPRSGGDPATKP